MHRNIIIALLSIGLATSCNDRNEPDLTVYMQPSAITTESIRGIDEEFAYDDYGRIISYSRIPADGDYSFSARYSYPDESTVIIESEDSGSSRQFSEIVYLDKGRAIRSEGTFVDMNVPLYKVYSMDYEYDPANHIVAVTHSEIQTDSQYNILDKPWAKPWTWTNYIIWEDGNLTEFQDMQGHSYVYQTTEYEYSDLTSDYPVVIPEQIVNSLHHVPLIRAGLFGALSKNLITQRHSYDRSDNPTYTQVFEYVITDRRIGGYSCTWSYGTETAQTAIYNVSWTPR